MSFFLPTFLLRKLLRAAPGAPHAAGGAWLAGPWGAREDGLNGWEWGLEGTARDFTGLQAPGLAQLSLGAVSLRWASDLP